jgi:hypothetical protein
LTTAVAKISDPAVYNVAGILHLPCGEAIDLTHHCVDRWYERVQIAAPSFRQAMLCLTWIAGAVGYFAPKAEWILSSDQRARYLYITDEIALIVVGQVVKNGRKRPPKALRVREQFSNRIVRLQRRRLMQRSISLIEDSH